jgi:Holliday junction resolvase RusA-like endonuclease
VQHTKLQEYSDVDNYNKFIQDVLSKLVYKDDKQVCFIYGSKVYDATAGSPGKTVIIVKRVVLADKKIFK